MIPPFPVGAIGMAGSDSVCLPTSGKSGELSWPYQVGNNLGPKELLVGIYHGPRHAIQITPGNNVPSMSQPQMIRYPRPPPCRVGNRQGNDFILDLLGRFMGKGPRYGRTVHKALKALFLDCPLILVELAPGDVSPPARLRDVPQPLREL